MKSSMCEIGQRSGRRRFRFQLFPIYNNTTNLRVGDGHGRPSGQGNGSFLACLEFEPSTIKDPRSIRGSNDDGNTSAGTSHTTPTGENLSLDRFNVHGPPTRRIFNSTRLELMTRQPRVLDLDRKATAAALNLSKLKVSTLGVGVIPQNWGGTKPNHTVTCMVFKATANDRRTSSPLPFAPSDTLR
ncbi:hypothetical protein TNCV_3314241 [Trichonephila clavipes]|nr:hypothetical protein TNCV_3314241 [Trichonephila clavipes]